jgi:hypothetical protein
MHYSLCLNLARGKDATSFPLPVCKTRELEEPVDIRRGAFFPDKKMHLF